MSEPKKLFRPIKPGDVIRIIGPVDPLWVHKDPPTAQNHVRCEIYPCRFCPPIKPQES